MLEVSSIRYYRDYNGQQLEVMLVNIVNKVRFEDISVKGQVGYKYIGEGIEGYGS